MPGKNGLPGQVRGSRSPEPESKKKETNRAEKLESGRKFTAEKTSSGSQKPAKGSEKILPVSEGKKTGITPAQNKAATGALVSPNEHSRNLAPGINTESLSGQTVPARDAFMQIAAAMGFPKDALSVALLAFARFFSLSINPQQMSILRRDILTAGKQSSPGNAEGRAALEADALSACIALDKGVALSPEVLGRLSGLLTIPVSPDSGFPQKDRGEDGKPDRDELPAAEEIKKIAEEYGGNEGFLDFLNVLPGKNGQYWVVYPFNIKLRGTELAVILRLLKREPVSLWESEQLMADIAGPKRQWRCFLEKKTGKFRADIQVFPEVSAAALGELLKDAELFFGKKAAGKSLFGDFSGFEKIVIRNGKETASWVDDLCDENLTSINEEV